VRIDRNYREKRPLADGTVVTLRTIRPRDREELARFVRRLSPDTFRKRFHMPPHEVDEATLQYLTEVDGADHVAVVATTESLDLKDEAIVGVARCIRLEGEPDVAEAAVVVLDALQNRGLGKLLGAAILDAASERGIRSFRAEVLASNAPVRKLLEDAGALAHSGDDTTIVFDVPLEKLRGRAEAKTDGADEPTLVQRILRAAADSMAFVVRTLVPLPAFGSDEEPTAEGVDEHGPRPSFTRFDANDLP
jgi:GNAT superfamily N-acetyltransferase